jgi:hypothetical protein
MRYFTVACVSVIVGAVCAQGAPDDLRHFVRVSERDCRYFELDNGKPYIPIGMNLIAPPKGDMAVMDEWFGKLEAQGGNYVRIWLGSAYFDVENAKSGEYSEEQAKHIDQLFASARKHGIRVKLCVDSFRHLGEGTQAWAAKPIHLVKNGGLATNMADWVNSPACRQRYKGKYDFYAKRYGSDPIIFGWELWNEMNAVVGGDVRGWTAKMLPELHKRFPKNLCVQSLGSFDSDGARAIYTDICRMPHNDVAQVHRYLDLGAKLEVCHAPVDVLAADAVRELQAFNVKKPILLAESGGVEPSHSGPSKLYEKDRDGLILHDVLFAPFFAGAAGPGHIWHWDAYVAKNDLWWHFGRFAQAVADLDPAAEAFQAQQVEHPRLRILVLRGKHTVLAWCRDKEATWQTALAEGRAPEALSGVAVTLPLPADSGTVTAASAYDPWTGQRTTLKAERGTITLPDFSRSIVIRFRSE